MKLNAVRARVDRILRNDLVRDTLWMALAQVLGVVMQVAYFVLIARALGAKDYGTFISITSFASILFPFVSLGSGDLLVKNVARDRTLFPIYWGNTLFIISVVGLGLAALSWLIISNIFSETIAPAIVVAILLTDLLFLNLWDASTKAFLSVELVRFAAWIKIFLNFNKLLAAIFLITWFQDVGIAAWAGLYCFSTALTALIANVLLYQMLGAPKLALSYLKAERLQGLFFSISTSADSINSNIDKTMLASLGTLEATGLYAAAYRCIDVGYLGLLALAGATYAKFFQQGAAGIQGSFNLAKRLFPVVSLYGVTACVALFLFAPVLPSILGDEYRAAIAAVQWLAPVPLLLSLQFLAADTLTGAGFQGMRSIVQVASAGVNVGLNFWLIPQYSWHGAVVATLVSETLKLLGLCGVVWFYYQRR